MIEIKFFDADFLQNKINKVTKISVYFDLE